MSNRKRAIASKRARGPKKAARAQRNKQAVIRSPRDNPLRSVAAGSIESRLKLDDDPKQKAPIVETRVDALPDDLSQKMTNSDPTKALVLATANLQAWHAKLLEMAGANMQFAFDFGLRLATLRSPFEFFAVIAEFTSRRIDMIGEHSKEMAAYPFWRIEARRERTDLPGR